MIPGTEPCSPVSPGNELRCSPVVPNKLETVIGLKPIDSITHIEIMTAVHTGEESDGTQGANDASGPSPSPEEEGRDIMGGDKGWTTIHRKGRKSRSVSREKGHRTETLDVELNRVVRAAERRLTPDDRRKINKRILALKNKLVHWQSDDTSETASKGEGPSTLEKGKGVDPRNWGTLSDESEDLDLDGQRATLESWNLARDVARLSAENSEEEDSDTRMLRKEKRRRRGKGKDNEPKPNVAFTSRDEARAKLREVLERPV